MSDINDQDDDYSYDEASAVKADNAASRITDGGAYVGRFIKAEAVTAQTGTKGISFTFDSPGNGTAEFTLYTKKTDGTEAFGMSFVNAMQFLFGLKGLKAVAGKVQKWDDAANARVEADGRVFPELCGKSIGIVLEKELTSKRNGGDSVRMNLYGLFQPETKLMTSEIKERKTTPVKLERLLKGLKVKDSRKAQADEPAQASLGGAGDY